MHVFSHREQFSDWKDGEGMARCPSCSQRKGWAAWSSSCSRNARPQKGLVRRAHSRIDQTTLWREKSSKDPGSATRA